MKGHIHISNLHPSPARGDSAEAKPLPKSSDIVIVGAGMSGLYAAWRIKEKNPNATVTILELLPRTGGRLDSDLIHIKNDDQNEFQAKDQDGEAVVKEEEGGMRFTFDMKELITLINQMDLSDQLVPFPMGSGGNNRRYYRGVPFTNADSSAHDNALWANLYNLKEEEVGRSPGSIVTNVFHRLIRENPGFSLKGLDEQIQDPKFWQRFRMECKWQGQTLNNWTLWSLFSSMGYSNECITMIYRALGFNGTFLSQMNAGVAFQLLEDFPDNPDFKTFRDGFSVLPNALVEKVGRENIFLKTRVVSLQETKDEEYPEVIRYARTTEGGVEEDDIHAKKVILALPRLALEKLFANSDGLWQDRRNEMEILWDKLQGTTNQPLLKINLYYEEAWWSKDGTGRPSVKYGPNFTDMPLGSVYPFYAVSEKEQALLYYLSKHQDKTKIPKEILERLEAIDQEKYLQPAALTIYCDYQNINYWLALQGVGKKFDSELQKQFSEKVPQVVFPASEAVVESATHMFKTLFGTYNVPQPILTSSRIWAGNDRFDVPQDQDFGYGVHQWALHADDRDIEKSLIEPFENVYICGEAYSNYQGWVEGALNSTNLVLEKGWKLKPLAQEHPEAVAGVETTYNKNGQALVEKYILAGVDAGSEGVALTDHLLDVFSQDFSAAPSFSQTEHPSS